MTYKKASEAS